MICICSAALDQSTGIFDSPLLATLSFLQLGMAATSDSHGGCDNDNDSPMSAERPRTMPPP
jgi:hypothetical protein